MLRLGVLIGTLKMGGAELQTIQLLERIDRSKIHPIVFTMDKEGPLSHRIKNKGIDLIPLNISKKKRLVFFKDLYHSVKESNLDVLYCMLWLPIILGGLIGKIAGAKYVVGGVRGLGMTWSKKKIWGLRVAQPLVDRFIVNSTAIKETHATREWIRREKIRVIGNGLDLEAFPYTPQKQQIIGIVGSLTEIKGHEQFIMAASKLLKNGCDYQFQIVGDGPKRGVLETLVKDLAISNYVTFTGNVQNVTDLVRNFKLLVSCSAYEGLSNAILEAMSTGTPIVASDVPTNNEVVTNMKTGLLYRHGDHNQLAEQIMVLLRDDDLHAMLQENCRHKVEQDFSMEQMVRNTEDFFLSL